MSDQGAFQRHALRVIFGALFLALAACTALYDNHGYAPTDDDLQQVKVGTTTKADLPDLIGRPSSSGVLSESGWYYVQSRWENYAWKAPKEIERQVIAISFAADGVVSNVERFGLQEGRVVPLQRRVTESNIKGISIIKQLLGNIGRVTAEQITN